MDNDRGIDVNRTLGSWQNYSIKLGYSVYPEGHGFSRDGYENNIPLSFLITDDLVGNGERVSEFDDMTETRPRNIALNFCIKY